MDAKIIMMADNDLDFLNTRREFLEQANYTVITADNPTDAGRILERGKVDLVILDLRLEDDNDEQDTSGLELARRFGQAVPIIILTGYPTWEIVKASLGKDLNGLSPAVDFLSKKEDPDLLIQSVNMSIKHPRIKKSVLHVFQAASSQELHEIVKKKEPAETTNKFLESLERSERDLLKHRKEISQQSDRYQKNAILLGLIGTGVLVVGAFLVFFKVLPPAIIASLAGVVSEVISARYIALAVQSSRQVDRNYEELQKIYKASHLISICDTIEEKSKREKAKLMIIEKLTGRWLG